MRYTLRSTPYLLQVKCIRVLYFMHMVDINNSELAPRYKVNFWNKFMSMGTLRTLHVYV